MAVARIGVAAHISAAAPGGRRYLPELTSMERTAIENAIWLCATHGTLIDQDDRTYSIDRLQRMKADHEARIGQQLRSRTTGLIEESENLVAIGPDTVCVGALAAAQGPHWEIRLSHFVNGSAASLLAFGDRFTELPAQDQHVLLNSLGDGRRLTEAPSWRRTNDCVVLTCKTLPAATRIRAQDLGEDLMVGPDHDLALTADGDLAMVSGVARLKQHVETCLSSIKGEMEWARAFGTRISEYFENFLGSPWLDQLVRLEAIRLAAIPYSDERDHEPYTPLRCVERVRELRFTGNAQRHGWVPVRVDMDVNGVGAWRENIELFVSDRFRRPRRANEPLDASD
jgi:hypothetical protein